MYNSENEGLKLSIEHGVDKKITTLILEGSCNKNSGALLEKYLLDLIKQGYLEIAIDARKLNTSEIQCYSIILKANQLLSKNGGHLHVIQLNEKMHNALRIIKANKFGLTA